MTGPARRVPSGNTTTGSPRSITASVRRNASRSAVPRLTGKAPSVLMNRPSSGTFQTESLVMKPSRRLVVQAAMAKSMFERWTGASTNAPVAGTFSLPSRVRRNKVRQMPSTRARRTRYR